MRTLESFSKSERRRSAEKLRRVDPSNASKVGFKPTYWSVPVLIRLLDRVDSVAADHPKSAIGLAEPLPKLARRIPIQSESRPDEDYYKDRGEARDFLSWSHCVLGDALRAAGKYREAQLEAEKAREYAGSASQLVRAEVLRRAANLATELREFEGAQVLVEEAIRHFIELQDSERTALALIGRGNLRNITRGAGTGSLDYANALYMAAQTKSPRSERAVIVAASNLAVDAARIPGSNLHDAFAYIEAAINAMRGRPLGIPKLMIQWARAVVSYRFGVGRYSVRWLERVRDGLLNRGALTEGLCCITDLLEMTKDYEDSRLVEVAEESFKAVEKAMQSLTPDDETIAAVAAWSSHPTDVEALRRDLKLDRAAISR